MRLPEDPRARRDAFIELGRECAVDRPERKAYHQELRSWYTRGTASEDRVRFNKIKSHVKKSAAYLFQSQSVRFGAVLDPEYGDQFTDKLDTVRDDFHRYWHDSKVGLRVSLGVRWAHVYPTVIWKVTPHNEDAVVTLVPDPGDIGVLEPDRPFDRQEAKIHFFWLTLAQFRRLIDGHPFEGDLLRAAQASAEMGGADEPTAPTVERLMFSSTAPQMSGVMSRGMAASPEAQVETARVLCCELWVVDDRIGAWRCVTCLAPSGQVQRILWDRKPSVLASTDPFVALSLEDLPDYTWGLSETDDLSGIQEWHEHRATQIDRMLELQLDPPIVLGGFGGLSDERAKRLRVPGGTLATSIPNPTAQRMAPTMPPEAFAELAEIGKFFAEAGNLPLPMQGQADASVRGGNQLWTMAALASPPTLEKAMVVEYATSELATLVWRMRRELLSTPLMRPDGSRFLLRQIPADVCMEVASHSASPLLAAAIKADALEMLKVGAIDRPTYVELKQPPMVDVLRARARKLEEAAAKKSERIMAIQELKAQHGRSR